MNSPENQKTIQKKVVVSACFGTFLEWYDFLTFASLAVYFSTLFFPADDPVAALLASLGTFGIGMIVRPLGAAIFGSLGDRHGRRTIFLATIVLMGVSTVLVGLLPTYEQVGLLAPALLLFLRVLQGLSVGGEIGGAAVYLTEHAPAEKRGLYTSVLQLMGPLGMMASTLQIVLLQSFLSDADFKAWGWRIPFIFSALLLAISIKSRLNLHESPVFSELRRKNALAKAPLRECFQDRQTLGRMALLFFCISAGGSLIFFSAQVYTGVFLKTVVKLPAAQASTLVMISTLALLPATIFCGWLSDRIGRKAIVLGGCLLAALTYMPLFKALTHYANPAVEEARSSAPAVVHADPATCSFQFDPVGKKKFTNSCDIATAALAKAGIPYTIEPVAAGTVARVSVGGTDVASYEGAGLAGDDAKAKGEAFGKELKAALTSAGYPEKADPARINKPMVVAILTLLVIYVTMVYGPIAAWLVELFPTRIRYTSMSLPYHIGNGWFGGFLPAISFALVAGTGNMYFGLWYPICIALLTVVVGTLFLRETKDVDISK